MKNPSPNTSKLIDEVEPKVSGLYSSDLFIPFEKSALHASIPARFEQQVEKYPEKIAVKSKGNAYTYTELNKKANQVSWVILEQTGETEEAIGLFFSDVGKTMAGMLGTLKAGKFYIPIDPVFPQERIQFMLADSETTLLLTDTKHVKFAREVASQEVRVVNIDEAASTYPTRNPALSLAPETRASLMYTSGSEGKPKGTIKDHQDRLRSALQATNSLLLSCEDRFGLLFSPSFGASIGPIYSSILNGASLHSYNIGADGIAGFAAWLKRGKISIIRTTPSVFRHFAKLLDEGDTLPDLRVIELGTEPIRNKDVALYKKHFSKHSLLQISYACTEIGVITVQQFDAESEILENVVPVGYPLPGKVILLWDENGSEVEKGDVGEIVVKGNNIQPTYWRDGGDVGSAFAQDSDGSGGLLYKTGDLGKLLSDGRLVILGRKDNMVKIRGYRVEVAEVESALIAQEFVSDAVVVAREDASGNKHLVAYLVASGNTNLKFKELRKSMSNKLPDYMVPARFVVVDKFPRTPTGKIDRNALPDHGTNRPQLDNVYTAPKDAVEIKLAGVWQAILNLERVGVKDNFFELGGDSLMAAQLFVEIEKAFNKKLPLSILYTAANIREQAVILRQKNLEADWSPIVKVHAAGSKPAIFCFPGKGGNPLRFRDLSLRLGEDQPVYMLQSRGLSGAVTPHVRIEDIAAEFKKSILEVQTKGPYYLIGSSGGGKVAYELAQQSIVDGEEVRLLAFVDSYGPGYPKQLPSTTRVKQQFFRRMLYIGKHIGNLRVASWRGRFVYFSQHIRMILRKAMAFPGKLYVKMKGYFGPSLPLELVEVERANLAAGKNYVPQPYPGRVVLFRASQQPWGIYPDRALGWGDVGIEDLVIHEVPGHHGSILFEPRVGELARILKRLLK